MGIVNDYFDTADKRISRIFLRNRFSMFVRGSGTVLLTKLKGSKISLCFSFKYIYIIYVQGNKEQKYTQI